ncbi:MAG: hypothetical protein JKX74_06345 [Flavobacteriales bacterium]|nr:hypothetical protein [Flavobacteriales bacterium]PCH87363.1 MAG: hypothetical protein COB88_05785 [Flavobacteriales bacterium]
MKNRIIGGLTVCVLLSLVFVIYPVNSKDRDWNECLEKYSFKWGKSCTNCMTSRDTYLVSYRNECSEKIDCMVCVQEKYKNWRCYTRMNLAPKDTIYGYACKGVGLSMHWVKQAGDNQIVFPTVEEVNNTYSD